MQLRADFQSVFPFNLAIEDASGLHIYKLQESTLSPVNHLK